VRCYVVGYELGDQRRHIGAASRRLDGILRGGDRSNGKVTALDPSTIGNAYDWLVKQFGLPADLVERPSSILCCYRGIKAKNPPKPLLLNSFYLRDLERCVSWVGQGVCPAGLSRYLGIRKPKQPLDLLHDDTELEKAVAPKEMPAARWPSRKSDPLVLLQQVAVNLARSELKDQEGIIAVNGPPGTGKTTLLRDVVAACVLDRALAMAEFEDPPKAFTDSNEEMRAGEKILWGRRRDSLLCKIVASSINGSLTELRYAEAPRR
jgi:hypothetical protein